MGSTCGGSAVITGNKEDLDRFCSSHKQLIDLEEDKYGNRISILSTKLYAGSLNDGYIIWKFFSLNIEPEDLFKHLSDIYPDLTFRYYWGIDGPDTECEGVIHNGNNIVYLLTVFPDDGSEPEKIVEAGSDYKTVNWSIYDNLEYEVFEIEDYEDS